MKIALGCDHGGLNLKAEIAEYLKSQNIDFEDLNVQEDMVAREEMINKSHQMSVPVLDINGKIIIGFDKPAILEAINNIQ